MELYSAGKPTSRIGNTINKNKGVIAAVLLIIYDFIAVVLSYFLALWIRFDCEYSSIPLSYLEPFKQTIIFYAVFCIIIFWLFHLYNSIWRFASYNELLRMIAATAITLGAHALAVGLFVARMPASYFIFGIVFQFIFTLGVRFAYRFILLIRGKRDKEVKSCKRVMIVGAGAAGQMIARDICTANETREKVYCFIDDDRNKKGRYIDGIKIIGGRDEILAACSKYLIDKIYIAMPSASAAERRDIIHICNETGAELMILPGMYQLASGDVTVSSMKPVKVEDLLGREPIRTDLEQVFSFIKGKVILVTGGGGSIGSELCRQIAAHEPKQLIIFEVYENNAYDIQFELKKKYPELNLVTLIGSVRDSRRIWQVFDTYRPQIVYHAAAHKHVPLMEDSPCEAVKNNTIGTYKTAYAAMTHGCERFVLISTDKAVNPTNQMGATKRTCEMICQAFDRKIKEGKADQILQLFTHLKGSEISAEVTEALKNTRTEFVAVRFGNVLGSNGSVIPLFKKQIEAGGPVTVTHPDIIRYFMTIPEAVSLVLQAGTYAHGGEIFVLDMGEPVKIDTLARNLIRLSGYKPDVDIMIEYSGLRPGEKLFEEKLMAEEGLRKTENELIHIGNPIPFDIEVFLGQLEELMIASYDNRENIRELMKEVVGTYKVE